MTTDRQSVPPVRESRHIVVFTLEGSLYGLGLQFVERVLAAVMPTPLPEAPAFVDGVIRIGPTFIPVVNLRRRFRLPVRALFLSDKLIVARTPRRWREGQRAVALVVDSVEGVREIPAEAVTPAPHILAGLEHLEGIIRTEDGMILIHDLGTLLSLDEEHALDSALAGEAP